MREVCIIGAGIHRFGRFEKTVEEMGREAAVMALKSAGVEWKQIEAAFVSNARFPVAVGHIRLTPLGRTGISIIDTRAACASGVAAMQLFYFHPALSSIPLIVGFISSQGKMSGGREHLMFHSYFL